MATIYSGIKRAQSVKAKILTDSYEIEGNIQLKQGMDGGRISDMLMASGSTLIPITQAKCTNRSSAESLPIKTECTMIHASRIKMVLPFED